MKTSKRKPDNLFQILDSAHEKIFLGKPFGLLKTQESRNYAALLVKECKVKESAVQKILAETFEPAAIFRDYTGKNHEAGAQAQAIFEGYTKAIEALKKLTRHKAIVADASFEGTERGRGKITLAEAIQNDIAELEQRRAHWAGLYMVHPETKAEPTAKGLTPMFVNQSYSVFRYIEKRHELAGRKVKPFAVHELLAELFKAIYSHRFFNPERFTREKIEEYCDNGRRKYKQFRETRVRKSIESVQNVKSHQK